MNHAYKLIWNTTLNLWQCASEITRSRGKSGSTRSLVDRTLPPPPRIALNRTSKRLRAISLILATLFPFPPLGGL
ncbi:ESPR domain-containing protein [Gallibacterium salpingitidis]|uniref:ESPR domain-containing protein n=1 Tax=Gallibacterium salpingitidis TaxID=505341 RepID=UPI00346138F0